MSLSCPRSLSVEAGPVATARDPVADLISLWLFLSRSPSDLSTRSSGSSPPRLTRSTGRTCTRPRPRPQDWSTASTRQK